MSCLTIRPSKLLTALTAAVLMAAALAARAAQAAPGARAGSSEKAKPAGSTAAAAPAAQSPTADEIVARYVAVRGGMKQLKALQTLHQEGHVSAGAGREGLVTRDIKRPGRVRFEFTVQGVTSVFASDGEHGWKVSPLEGDMGPHPLPEDVVMEAGEQADIDGPLVDWKGKGHQLELSGREPVDGREAYKLKLTLKSGAVLYAFVDVKSHYLVRTESTRRVRGRSVRIETSFRDYKKTGGILFPRLVEVRAAGRPNVLRVVVDKVEVNRPLSDALFAPPA